jgi:hypothetical protein
MLEAARKAVELAAGAAPGGPGVSPEIGGGPGVSPEIGGGPGVPPEIKGKE